MELSEKQGIFEGLQQLVSVADAELEMVAEQILADNVVFDIAHPVNQLVGRKAVLDGFYRPLRAALAYTRRRDEIFISAANRRDFGGDWISAVTHYVGNFNASLFGVRPHHSCVFLRSGEFYQIENGKIILARLIPDFIDLMRQARRLPIKEILGTEILFPGPATHDGVMPQTGDGEASLDVVEGMLGDLHVFDPDSFESKSQTGDDGYWHDDMLWYGPCGIGSNYRWDGFVKDHRESFLRAFPDRQGGNHYCRIGEGHYAAVSGWPSMTMTHQADYLGIKATGRAMTLRVMDFYRVADNKIMENWVLLDYGELFEQMGFDIFAAHQEME
ncbi:MAG: ester cyclase [Candidatus Puniceispirillaceae bacterium]